MMANNRLYIVDLRTGDKFLLAKSFGRGWIPFDGDGGLFERLATWLHCRDLAASHGLPEDEHTELVLTCIDDFPGTREMVKEIEAFIKEFMQDKRG